MREARSKGKIKHAGPHSAVSASARSHAVLKQIDKQATRQPQPLAVALRHTPAAPAAPRIVASARGFAAERILELAFANGVKVREDADLAEMLAAVGIGDEIPFAAFSAVAEILAYIYRANQAVPNPCEPATDGPVTP
jgi:flagellar biosynthesis protein